MTKEYLNNLLNLNISDAQNRYYRFLLDNGKILEPCLNIKDEVPNINIHLSNTEIKSCYNNSIKASFLNKKLKYFEGFYVTDTIDLPLEHAFNVIKDSVFDFTAVKFNIKVKEYFGVEIPLDVLETYVNLKTYETPLQFFYKKSL
jgi:hypothetical protein